MDQYIGSNVWYRLVYEPGDPIKHYHACPVCYEYKPCHMACTLEPDLERNDGSPCGSHMVCSEDCSWEAADEDYPSWPVDEGTSPPFEAKWHWPVPKEQLAFEGFLDENLAPLHAPQPEFWLDLHGHRL